MDYLLGNLEEAERSSLEKQLFASDDTFAELLAAEDGLIDKYIGGSFTEEERSAFESNFLQNPARTKHLETERSIRGLQATTQAGAKSTLRSKPVTAEKGGWQSKLFGNWGNGKLAFTAVAAIVFLAVTWTAWQYVRTPETTSIPEPGQNEPQNDRPMDVTLNSGSDVPYDTSTVNTPSRDNSNRLPSHSNQAINAPTPSVRNTAPQIATFILGPGASRGSGSTANAFKLSNATHTAVFNLKIDRTGLESLAASIQTPEGAEVWKQSNVRFENTGSLSIQVPANSLRRGDYILTVTGRTSAGTREKAAEYAFTIERF